MTKNEKTTVSLDGLGIKFMEYKKYHRQMQWLQKGKKKANKRNVKGEKTNVRKKLQNA